MAKYLDKWKDLFPDTVGGTTRPSEAVSDQEEFNTDGFPQFIAQDPVNYALQNAFLKQFLSNDARLWVKQKQANQALDDHKVDTQAHAKGISGNAGSATKLANARTINLSGAVTADAVSFDGTADATINVKTLDASKLKGTASVSTTGNAATATKVVTTAADGASANIAEAKMASNDLARIRVSGTTNAGELALETADAGSEPIVARQYTGIYTTPVRTAKILDESGNTSFPGTVVAPKFTGTLNGNAATASKLATPRTFSLTGKAAGSTTFDGSANATINVTSVNADTATKATQDGAGNVITNTYLKKAGDTATGDLTAPNFVGHLKGNADTATRAAAADMATNDGNGNNIVNTYLKKATVIDVIYPVGSIYMSMSATNPATLFGVGTWARISQGRMLLGADDSTYKAGATGGEATHTLTANEMPAHSHGISTSGDHSHKFYGADDNNGNTSEGAGMGMDTGGNGYMSRNMIYYTANAGAHTHTISNSGGGAAHNNMPPYLVCYMWQRTA